MDPALREDVPDGVGESLETLPCAGGRQLDNVIEEEMPLVERVVGARELNRPAAVLLQELRLTVGMRCCGWGGLFPRGHCRLLSFGVHRLCAAVTHPGQSHDILHHRSSLRQTPGRTQ